MVKKKKKEKNEFVQAVYDIHKVAATRMDKKNRRNFLQKEAEKLGVKSKKNPKIPYNIYQGILRKEKEIQMQEKEDFLLNKEATYFNPVKKKNKKPQLRQRSSTPKTGKYKNGTLYLNKSLLSK